MGLLLPCNVVVRATESGTRVEALDPQIMVQLSDHPELKAVAGAAAVHSAEDDGRDWLGFLDGLKAGWAAFVNALAFTLTVLGASLPFLPFIVGLGWLAQRRRPTAPVPAP